MSKNDRHIPYEVAYERVTGRKRRGKQEVSEVSLTSILDRARNNGEKFLLRGDAPMSFHIPKIMIGSSAYFPSYHSRVKADRLRFHGVTNVYPEEFFHIKKDPSHPERRIYPRSHSGVESLSPLTDPNVGLIEPGEDKFWKFMDAHYPKRAYNVGDRSVMIPDVHEAHLNPITTKDDTVMFAIVEEKRNYSYDFMKNSYSYEEFLSVALYEAESDNAVLTEISYDDEYLTHEQNDKIHRLSFAHLDNANKNAKERTHEYRRSAERNALRDAVKYVNAGNDPDSLDVDRIDYVHGDNKWYW